MNTIILFPLLCYHFTFHVIAYYILVQYKVIMRVLIIYTVHTDNVQYCSNHWC